MPDVKKTVLGPTAKAALSIDIRASAVVLLLYFTWTVLIGGGMEKEGIVKYTVAALPHPLGIVAQGLMAI